MKIAFFSNYLTHHQIPFCNELVSNSEIDFYFISTCKMEEERINGGWCLYDSHSYEIKTYESKENELIAERLCLDSDVVIFGSCPHKYIELRLSKTNKLSFLYSERLFKNGRWHAFSHNNLKTKFSKKSLYKNKMFYLLCAGAYVAKDFKMLGCFTDRCYKWGYFPKTRTDSFASISQKKQSNTILWVGRFIKWKHPEYAVKMAMKMKKQGIDFKLTMIGNGPLKPHIESMIKSSNLNNNIVMIDSISPDEVRNKMEQNEIYILTSDQNEGWGAVLNEAMNAGCAVVCSNKVGSVPFLVRNNINGVIFKSKSFKDFYKKVSQLYGQKDRIVLLGKNAFETISHEWNEKEAATRFLLLCRSILSGNVFLTGDGICSKAELK